MPLEQMVIPFDFFHNLIHIFSYFYTTISQAQLHVFTTTHSFLLLPKSDYRSHLLTSIRNPLY